MGCLSKVSFATQTSTWTTKIKILCVNQSCILCNVAYVFSILILY